MAWCNQRRGRRARSPTDWASRRWRARCRRRVEGCRKGYGRDSEKKAAEGGRPLRRSQSGVEGDYIAGGGTLGALLGVVADLRAFGERLVAAALNRAVVDEE